MHPNLVELTDSSKQEAYNCNNIPKEQKKKIIEKLGEQWLQGV